MCLSIISETKPGKTGIGYKVFHKKWSGLYGELMGSNGKKRPCYKWLFATDFSYLSDAGNGRMICADSSQQYKSGWHIFKDLKSAITWRGNCLSRNGVIKGVKYRNATTKGKQVISTADINAIVYGDIVVADEIYIYKKEIK